MSRASLKCFGGALSVIHTQTAERLALAYPLDQAIQSAAAKLRHRQRDDGHWVFELEADATIPAEYLLLGHYLGEIDDERDRGITDFLRSLQGEHGGWPLFHGGDFNISASVKAYFALKAAGDSPDAPHMGRARAAILAHGGAAKCNVFTRIQLALFGELPWRGVPVMPVEIMLLPRWFPFHLNKVSYWSRTVMVPLLVLMALKPRARNPRRISVAELYTTPPESVRNYHDMSRRGFWASVFRGVDAVLRRVEPRLPASARQRAVAKAERFVLERLNGEEGLGAIYPAMANTVMMFDCLGYPKDHPAAAIARRALEKLMVRKEGRTYCQPCLSPIWDTSLAALAMLEAGDGASKASAIEAARWLKNQEIIDTVGDWAEQRPGLKPGGWAFQYANAFYPDVDDTAVVAMALDRVGDPALRPSVDRAAEWVVGMQSRNGGWGAFDADNTHHYLNYIPFADHGALLDPPTSDVTARCVSFLAQIGRDKSDPVMIAALDFLAREQEPDGSWFGRWGTNYIYGTWSVLCAYNAAGIDMTRPDARKAATWLLARQRADGGWGEDGRSYQDGATRGEAKTSTASQTAWALLGLMAAGEVRNPAVKRGIKYLLESQGQDGLWPEKEFTAVGFPRVFYLRYHGYPAFFPLWALSRYRNLRQGNADAVIHGM